VAKIKVRPRTFWQVLQQQIVNMAGDGKLLETWLKPQ